VLGGGDQVRVRVRHLDGHEALELLVAGQEDTAEAALVQEPLDTVAVDMRGEEGGRVGDGLPFALRGGPQGVGAFAHGRLGAGTTVVGSPPILADGGTNGHRPLGTAAKSGVLGESG
jgi:hypothetical protein